MLTIALVLSFIGNACLFAIVIHAANRVEMAERSSWLLCWLKERYQIPDEDIVELHEALRFI